MRVAVIDEQLQAASAKEFALIHASSASVRSTQTARFRDWQRRTPCGCNRLILSAHVCLTLGEPAREGIGSVHRIQAPSAVSAQAAG